MRNLFISSWECSYFRFYEQGTGIAVQVPASLWNRHFRDDFGGLRDLPDVDQAPFSSLRQIPLRVVTPP